MRERTKQTALRYGILDRLEDLEADLLKIKEIPDVDFDVENYGEIPHVILIPHYDIPADAPSYFSLRQNTLSNILIACTKHDLWPSGDRIEDMGTHWYIVRSIGKTWPRMGGGA